MSKKIKLLASLLIVFAIITAVPGIKANAKGQTKQQNIGANVATQGVLTEDVSEIYYCFTAPADGVFYATVDKKNITDDPTYAVKLLDSTGSKEFFSEDGSSVVTCKIGAKKGSKYYITVADGTWWLSETKNKPFNIKVVFQNANNWDNEPNNSQKEARLMSVNTDYYGTPVNDDEEDYFLAIAPSDGYFVFNVSHKDITDDGSYGLEIQTITGKEVTKDDGEKVTTYKIGVKKGQKIYVNVSGNYGARYQIYKLRANFTVDPCFENETNNTSKTAKVITDKKTYKGIIGNWPDDDSDYYKFTVKKTSTVSIFFGPTDISKTGKWKVVLQNSKGKEAEIMETDARKTVKVKLKKGNYYIKVEANWGADEKEYQLKITSSKLNIGKKKPVIKSATVTTGGFFNNRKFTGCKIKGVKGVDGYEVKVSTNKKMKKPAITEDLTGANKLNCGKFFNSNTKTFFVQIRPFVKDPFGAKIYGKKSAIKKTKLKKK